MVPKPFPLKKIAVVIAALAVSSATAARAQVPRVYPTPAEGELIRVTPGGGGEAYTGRLANLGGDTLLLRGTGRDTAMMMAIASRDQVEVSRRRREQWSGVGALAGVVAGIIASQLQSADGNAGLKRTQTAVVGGAAGAVIGGFTGFLLAPRRWQPLRARLPRMPLPSPAQVDTLAPAAGTSAPGMAPSAPAGSMATMPAARPSSATAPAVQPDSAAAPPVAPPSPAPVTPSPVTAPQPAPARATVVTSPPPAPQTTAPAPTPHTPPVTPAPATAPRPTSTPAVRAPAPVPQPAPSSPPADSAAVQAPPPASDYYAPVRPQPAPPPPPSSPRG